MPAKGMTMAKKKNKSNSVLLEIDGPKITTSQFKECVRHFFDLIDVVATDVSGKRKTVEWVVSVVPGSIGLCATAYPANGNAQIANKTVLAIGNGINQISQRRRPDNFNDTALEKVFELGAIVGLGKYGISSIRIHAGERWSDISPSSVAYVSDLLGSPTQAYGTIEGQLLALDLHGRLKFIIDETLTGKRIKCFFGEDVYNNVIKALKQRVAAYGLISYKKGGFPRSIEIQKITVFPDDDKLPKFKDIIGLFAG